MLKAITFRPEFNGIVYLEWERKDRGYAYIDLDVSKLSRVSFKRLVRWLIQSGDWYLDYRLDGYGEEYSFGTCEVSDTTELEYLTPVRIARWLFSERG